jgi:hypothetical protein
MTILISLLFISQSSHAEIYKWVDEKGTVHFTEDPATIPEKYQDKAKSRQTEEDLMSPEEKARARIEYERDLKERARKEQKAYEKSLSEERLRKKHRELEDAKEEERLKTEKEEKARKLSKDMEEQKAKEEVKPLPIRDQIPRQEKRIQCWYCNGKGYIPCGHCNPGGSSEGTPFKGKISKMFVGNSRTGGPYTKQITCPYCNGIGENRCSECNGVGYVWK